MSQKFIKISVLTAVLLAGVLLFATQVKLPSLVGQSGCTPGAEGCSCIQDEMYGDYCNGYDAACVNGTCYLGITCENRDSTHQYGAEGVYGGQFCSAYQGSSGYDVIGSYQPPYTDNYTKCDTGAENAVFWCPTGSTCEMWVHSDKQCAYVWDESMGYTEENQAYSDWGGDIAMYSNCVDGPTALCPDDNTYGVLECELHMWWCKKCPDGKCPGQAPAPTDNCPNDPNKTEPGVCGCGVADTDSDSDGTPDCNDECPDDSNKTTPGECGCGKEDADSDNDGSLDCNDQCPDDPNKTSFGFCGCGVEDIDSNNDGTYDCNQCEPTEEFCLSPSGNTVYCCVDPKVCASQDIQDAAAANGIVADGDSSDYIMCSYTCSSDQDCINQENEFGDILRTDRDEGCFEPYCNDLGFCRKKLACGPGEHCYEKSEGIFVCLPCDDSVLESCQDKCEDAARAERRACNSKWDPNDLSAYEACLDAAKENFRICIEDCADEDFCDSGGGYTPPTFPDVPLECTGRVGCDKAICEGDVDFCYNGDQCTQPYCNLVSGECEYIPWQVPIDGCNETGDNGDISDNGGSSSRRFATRTGSDSSQSSALTLSTGSTSSASDSDSENSSSSSSSSSFSSLSSVSSSEDGVHMKCIEFTCTMVLEEGEDTCATDNDCSGSSFSSSSSSLSSLSSALSISFGFSSLSFDLSSESSSELIAFEPSSTSSSQELSLSSLSSSSALSVDSFGSYSSSDDSGNGNETDGTNTSRQSKSSTLSITLSVGSVSSGTRSSTDDNGNGDNNDGVAGNGGDEDDDGNGVDDDGVAGNQEDDDNGDGDNDDGIAGNNDEIRGCTSNDECSVGVCANGNCIPCLADNECVAGQCRNGRCTGPSLVAAAGICGNGVLEAPEECDDSNRRNDDGCSAECLLEIGICGDGVVQTLLGEQCEQATFNASLPYSCVRCRFVSTTCGDGTVDAGEECDDGLSNSTSANANCRPDCSLGRCGDGILDSTELCDDGNRLSGDGCDRYCIGELTQVAGQQTQSASSLGTAQPGNQFAQYQFPYNANGQPVPYQLPLAQLQPLIQSQGPVGDTGPAAVAVIGAGAAAGFSWMRRKKK